MGLPLHKIRRPIETEPAVLSRRVGRPFDTTKLQLQAPTTLDARLEWDDQGQPVVMKDELLRWLNICPSTLRNWRKRGLIPPPNGVVQLGGRLVHCWRLESVVEVLRQARGQK